MSEKIFTSFDGQCMRLSFITNSWLSISMSDTDSNCQSLSYLNYPTRAIAAWRHWHHHHQAPGLCDRCVKQINNRQQQLKSNITDFGPKTLIHSITELNIVEHSAVLQYTIVAEVVVDYRLADERGGPNVQVSTSI